MDMIVDDLIYGKLLDSLYPKSFLMTDEDGLQHEVIHYGDVKNAIEDFRIELKKRVGVSKMENGDTISRQPKHGKWKTAYLDHEAMGERPRIYYCSVCCRCIAYPTNFCPNCGAKMERNEDGTD